ncbi:alpha/beta hydrolase [Streptomyces sp. RB110-1]|uniref:alpha/beta hydrolase family protein n=1 Tax=unclassified Streptomyces TaxID=2593676 RepID=UPI0019025F86|nr:MULTISPECIES: alpha/beta hydrolase [unclassified Streptomyces]MBK0376019.1 alpha/beta hydrolase [Streptomyces sp. RB110-1]MBK0387607.1 alpha/beta hydrolase [Streptomyces sp. RB110-2]
MTDFPGSPDSAARERDAAESASAFAHPAVAPDRTAAYGAHPDQVVDFYAPRDGRTGAPLVVLLHGGAWRSPYDRAHVSPLADFLARRGFAVANVEYRRGGDDIPRQRVGAEPGAGSAGPVAGRWPETFDDVAAALDAMPALASRELPGADVRRIVVSGHSAGGHLALWAAARHVLPEGSQWRLPAPPSLRGVVALAPIADFATAVGLGVCGGAVTQLLGGEAESVLGGDAGSALGGDAVAVERAAHADPGVLLPTGIATAIVHGVEDIVVPPAVSEAYVDAAARSGETVGLTLLGGVGHFPLIDPSADACAVVAEELAQLAW